MQVLFDKLINVMRQTERCYQELLPLIQKEKEMVRTARVNELTSVSSEKERLLDAVGKLDQQRSSLIRQLAAGLKLGPDDLHLSKLADFAEPSQGHQLRQLRLALKALLSKIRSLNNENRALIHHCLGLVRQALSLVSPQAAAPSVYQASGAMTQNARGGKLVSNIV